MTVNELIANVDALRPSAYTPAQKTAWLSDVDGKISTEIMGEEAPVTYAWPQDGDRELLVSAPYDRMYGYYIMAMTGYYNSETDEENVSSALFEEAYAEYARQYRRTHRPEAREGFSVM
jgi:hypothetical protein